MTRQMAIDFGPLGVRVNAICPGHIVTEGLGRMWADNAEGLKFFAQQYPVRRTGTPDDIAAAIEAAGLDMDRPIVASCGSGVTAGMLAFGIFLMGKEDVAVYDGSWTEWGGREDTPIET